MRETQTEQVTATLRSHGLRATPQRRAIWGSLAACRGRHLGAEEVLAMARTELPQLSRATVYNALGELVAAGLLSTVDGAGRQLYDLNATPHPHFRCRSCGGMHDVEVSGLESVGCDEPGFVVERAEVLFEGLCPACSPAN